MAKKELTLEQAIATVNNRFEIKKCDCGRCTYCAWIRLLEFIETMQASAFCCGNCGSYLVKTTEDVETVFLYGETRELECIHPVRVCLECGEQWTDMEFAYIQTEAVLQHLKEEMATMHEQLAHHQAYPDVTSGKVTPDKD